MAVLISLVAFFSVLAVALSATDPPVVTYFNATVALNGRGNFSSINAAIEAAPTHLPKEARYVIKVMPGIYAEYVAVPEDKTFITLSGEDANTTVITGNRSHASGFKTKDTATMDVLGEGFLGVSLTIENTAGPAGGQAVALKNGAPRSSFYRCIIGGYQDTLYVDHSQQFYKQCDILGTVDFIFGFGPALFQDCRIIARDFRSEMTITAQGTASPTDQGREGFVFQNCSVQIPASLEPQKGNISMYLGRPWGDYSKVVFMQCFMDSVVPKAGWEKWLDPPRPTNLLFYGEYDNRGPGSDTSGRVNWTGYHLLTEAQACGFTVSQLITGDSWIPALRVPYYGGLLTWREWLGPWVAYISPLLTELTY